MLSTEVIEEVNIEEELRDDDFNHAIPFCFKHMSGAFFPATGAIVEAICGKLVRVRSFIRGSSKKCPKCSGFHGKIFHCYYCGKELVG